LGRRRRAWPTHIVEQVIDRLGERQSAEDLVNRVGAAGSLAKEHAAGTELEPNGRPGDEAQLLADGDRKSDLALGGDCAFHV